MLSTCVHNVILLKFDSHVKCEAFPKRCSNAVISEYHGKVISEYQIPAISWKLQLYKTLHNSKVEKCTLISAEDLPPHITL